MSVTIQTGNSVTVQSGNRVLISAPGPQGPAGADGGAADPWSPNSFVFIDPVNGNDTTGDGTSSAPWATANKALTEGIHRWIIAPGDAGSVTWENVSGDGDFYVFGFAANDFIETGVPVNDPQTQVAFVCNGVNNEHLHIYSNKGVTINVTGHSSGATGPDVSIFNAVVGDVDLSGNDGGVGEDGGIGGLLSINDCLVLGSLNCDAGQAGDGGNPGNGGVLSIGRSEVRGSISALGYGGTASEISVDLSTITSTPTADSISIRTCTIGGVPKFDQASFIATGGGSNSVTLEAPPTVPSNLTFTLPFTDGTSGQSLRTNGTGNLSFGTLGVAGGGLGVNTLSANAVILGNGTSAVQAVAPSTSGNVLTSNGTTWTSAAPPSGALVLLASSTASASATVTFDNVFTSTYDTYELHWFGVAPATDNVTGQITLRDSTPADMTSTYRWGIAFTGMNAVLAGDLSNQTATAGVWLLHNNSGNAANELSSGSMRFWPRATTWKSGTWHCYYTNTSGQRVQLVGAWDQETNTQAAGIKFSFSSGNIATGKFLLYGIKN